MDSAVIKPRINRLPDWSRAIESVGGNFQSDLVKAIPKARLYARALTLSVHDADDIVQQSLLRAIEKKEQFEMGTNIEAWLITIIKNIFFDQQKSHRVTKTESLEAKVEETGFDVQGPGDPAEAVELSEVSEFINDLPVQERIVVRMSIEGMKYQEISDTSGLTPTNVGVLLCRAKKKIYAAFPER